MENSNWCTKCNGKGTRSAQVLLSQIPPKQLILGRKMRGRTRRRTPRTPRSRSKGFPSLRGESDWWKRGSRSPLSLKRKNTSSRGLGSMGKKIPFYRWEKIQPLCSQPAPSGTTAPRSGTTARAVVALWNTTARRQKSQKNRRSGSTAWPHGTTARGSGTTAKGSGTTACERY